MIILLLSYFIGIFLTAMGWRGWDLTFTVIVVGMSFMLVFPYFFRIKPRLILIHSGLALCIILLATGYFHYRVPFPSANDVSQLISEKPYQRVMVKGKLLSEPRMSDSLSAQGKKTTEKVKFWLAIAQVNDHPYEGKVYATLPEFYGADLVPNQRITLQGILYRPSSPQKAEDFDFKAYLAKQGAFAGLKGTKLLWVSAKPWGCWQLRQRIVSVFSHALDSRQGTLIASIVLGRKAVDLAPDIRDDFIIVGLAHVLAASGFHVSLLLGLVLKLSERFSAKVQLGLALVTLVFYVLLTGIQPSIIRASLMGVIALTATLIDCKIHPLAVLLGVADVILLFNPLWIEDIGFQLSFLATLGLIIMMRPLIERLDWLPPRLAEITAIPIAAMIWTFPLAIYHFQTFPTYSLLVNIITTPLIMVISLGGMISAITALLYPFLGMCLVSFLKWPIALLMAIVHWFAHFPFSSLSISLPIVGILFIYSSYTLVCLSQWWQKRWGLMALLILALMIL